MEHLKTDLTIGQSSSVNQVIVPKAFTKGKAYKFQTEAVNHILNTFKSYDRTHVVMACGTGKTRVGLWVAEQLKAKNIVIFVPSLALINQLLKEWLMLTQWKEISCLAVCSDETVTKDADTLVLNPEECDFPVTTDPVIIYEFLNKKTSVVKILFCTYHSSLVLAKGHKNCKPFDLGVFDEAHKTAGKNHFSLALSDKNIPIQKRLFMTATPKHYDINHRNKLGDAKLVYSMDSFKQYGPRAYTFSFRRAINEGVIANYKVMISLINAKNKTKKKMDLEKQIVALRKAMLKDKIIKKVISFHRTIEEAYNFTNHIHDNHAIPKFLSLHVSSYLTTALRKDIMHSFQGRSPAIISNARCLTEGIDVPAVDMVALLNKKHSKIDIIQAIGRALRKVPGKDYGYVFLPLFIEQNKGEALEEAIQRVDYGDIWQVLQALSEQDEDLHAAIRELKQEKGRTGKLQTELDKYLEIIAHDNVKAKIQQILKKSISVAILDKIGSSWDEMYGRLLNFKDKYGHCNVRRSFEEDVSLATWVKKQRKNRKNNELTNEKIMLLNSIAFDWLPIETKWYNFFEKLKKFKQQYGHCNVPMSFEKDEVLARWVNTQRRNRKNNELKKDKIALLDSIGFDWSPIETQWYAFFERLKKFKQQYGHCNIPYSFKKDRTLAM